MFFGPCKKSIFWLFPEDLQEEQKQLNCFSKKKKKWIYFLNTYLNILSQFYLLNKYLIIF